jgi:hypothetical protein
MWQFSHKTEDIEMATEKKREGSVITVSNDEVGGVQMFHVASVGTLVLYHRPEGDIKGLSDAVIHHAAYHGMEQRIRDAGALGYDEDKKRFATPQEKHAAMRELVEYYNSGATEWSLRGGISEGSLLFRALMREKPDREPEKIKAWITAQDARAKDGKVSKGWRRDLLDSDRLIDIVRAIRKEDGKSVDADAMLDTLDA